jgi:hypothetical protein
MDGFDKMPRFTLKAGRVIIHPLLLLQSRKQLTSTTEVKLVTPAPKWCGSLERQRLYLDIITNDSGQHDPPWVEHLVDLMCKQRSEIDADAWQVEFERHAGAKAGPLSVN